MTEARRTQTASASFGTIISKQTQHAKNTKAAQTARGALTFSEQTEKCAIQHESTRKRQAARSPFKNKQSNVQNKTRGRGKTFPRPRVTRRKAFNYLFCGAQKELFSKTDIAGKNAPFLTQIRRIKTRFFIHQRSIAPHICADYCLFELSSSAFKTSEFANTSEFVSS